ncbi:hypothetical protein [Actinoplanes derwentensis]|uniref:MAE-28990/MAE-18760-like HEPN domain-containing protein n=1 Tax=Actinoplanes derwentensis TaxID=113562 RepID=A0A1H2DCY1_9ACTN|nr:hypothetical protein [Actinoplanes derwentensis]GID90477.1 hypothetical protein Ade03nite_94010 [Actinoplanes derwentensis]SDT80352.1 hypothetical protein SAMN04489716_9166 [Actinoplanes derwentensis]
MTAEPVQLQLAENALEDIIGTFTRHTMAAAGYKWNHLRHRIIDGPAGDGIAAERAACWLRMISIVEIFGEALLRELDGDTARPVPGSWSQVTNFLKQRHYIDLHDIPGWDRLEACFLVRNAIAHGLGHFTAKQVEKGVPRKIRGAGVAVRDGMVVITAASLASCADVCRRFITDLDAYPQVGRRHG